MAVFENDDIDTMLAEGVAITVAGVTKKCWLEDYDEQQLQYEGAAAQTVRQRKAKYKTSDFPMLTKNTAVTVDGVNYTVYDLLRIGDGGVTELTLREV